MVIIQICFSIYLYISKNLSFFSYRSCWGSLHLVKMFRFILILVLIVNLTKEYKSSKSKLPSSMDQRLYCMGCIATVKEMSKILSKRRVTSKNRESKVMELLESICSADNFVQYEYSPPKTQSACNLLIENHEEEIENVFVKDKKDKEKKICYDISEACEGVDTKERSPSSNADIDLSKGSKEGEKMSKTVMIDPDTGKVSSGKQKNKGKTMSKKDRKKKAKKPNKTKKEEKNKKKDDNMNMMNVDINDPASMEKVMEQIKQISKQNQNKKEEL